MKAFMKNKKSVLSPKGSAMGDSINDGVARPPRESFEKFLEQNRVKRRVENLFAALKKGSSDEQELLDVVPMFSKELIATQDDFD